MDKITNTLISNFIENMKGDLKKITGLLDQLELYYDVADKIAILELIRPMFQILQGLKIIKTRGETIRNLKEYPKISKLSVENDLKQLEDILTQPIEKRSESFSQAKFSLNTVVLLKDKYKLDVTTEEEEQSSSYHDFVRGCIKDFTDPNKLECVKQNIEGQKRTYDNSIAKFPEDRIKRIKTSAIDGLTFNESTLKHMDTLINICTDLINQFQSPGKEETTTTVSVSDVMSILEMIPYDQIYEEEMRKNRYYFVKQNSTLVKQILERLIKIRLPDVASSPIIYPVVSLSEVMNVPIYLEIITAIESAFKFIKSNKLDKIPLEFFKLENWYVQLAKNQDNSKCKRVVCAPNNIIFTGSDLRSDVIKMFSEVYDIIIEKQ